MNAHGPHSGYTQGRVFYERGSGQPGFLIVRNTHAPRVCKDDPDGVHCNREEMIEEQDGICCETGVFRHHMRGKKDTRKKLTPRAVRLDHEHNRHHAQST